MMSSRNMRSQNRSFGMRKMGDPLDEGAEEGENTEEEDENSEYERKIRFVQNIDLPLEIFGTFKSPINLKDSLSSKILL